MTTTWGRRSEEVIAHEEIVLRPRPPEKADPYHVRGACSRRKEVLVIVLAAPVRIAVPSSCGKGGGG